jgi:hypothetical protein
MLGDPGMADSELVLQRSYVALAIPQLLDDSDALRVPKDAKKRGKLPGDQNSVRHGSSSFCYKVQTFEYKVASEQWGVKSLARLMATCQAGRAPRRTDPRDRGKRACADGRPERRSAARRYKLNGTIDLWPEIGFLVLRALNG